MHVTHYVVTFGSYIGACKTLVCLKLVSSLGVIMDFAIVAIVLLTVASPSLGAGSNYIVHGLDWRGCDICAVIMHVMVVVL